METTLCNICGSIGVSSGGDGFYYCQACGTQSQDLLEQAIGDDEMVFQGIYSTSYRRTLKAPVESQADIDMQTQIDVLTKMQKVNRTGDQSYAQLATASDSDDDAPLRDFGFQHSFTAMDPEILASQIKEKYLDGIQMMIQMQCEALVEKFGVSPLICGVAGPIWLHFVASTHVLEQGWANESLQVADALAGVSKGRDDDFDYKSRYQKSKKFKAEPRSSLYGKKARIIWARSLKDRIPLTISLVISFLACHIAREAVLPTDVIKWVLEGKLPYLAAFVDIENTLSSVSTQWPLSPKYLLRPSRVLASRQLELMSGCLAKRIGLKLPPVNFHSISRRFLKQLSLPEDKIFPALSRMYEWSLPPGLWLSADINAFPTRVYVMGMLVVVIRILYNIHGQGYLEKSVTANDAFASGSSNKTCNQEFSRDQLDRASYRLARTCPNNVNIKPDGLPTHPTVKQPGEILISSTGSMTHFQDPELDATTMLQNLETWRQDNTDRFDYGKDLPTYLKYCKDVIFAGAKMSYDEEVLVKHFWQIYEKLEKEDLDNIQGVEVDAFLDPYISNTRQKNISQSVDENNVILYQRDCNLTSNVAGLHYPESGVVKQDIEATFEEIRSRGSPKVKDIGGNILGSIISDMEQNGFQYIPPTRSQPSDTYRDGKEGYVLGKRAVCTHTCGVLCFPRIRGICFGNSQVTLCDGGGAHMYSGMPKEMRFDMEKHRKKVPVRDGFCPGWDPDGKKPDGNAMNARWIHGLHMVADLTLMPYGKAGPNPHHESEKVIPAILMSQLYDLKNASFYWFADPHDPTCISVWSKGLLKVFASQMKVEYLRPAVSDESPICFEDAIIFAGMTNGAYIPDEDAHDWLRQKVLTHCDIPIVKARRPLSDAVVIHRPNSLRNIVNFEDMQAMLERELHLAVKVADTGPREFCQQVRLVAETDFLLTPHGSQNVAVLFSRPNAVILEVFPLLYYVDWLGNLLHTGRMHHYELYGTWTTERLGMPFRMRLYALLIGWKRCFYVRQCMNYGKTQKIFVDLEQLQDILHTLTSSCRVAVHGSRCLTSLVSNRTIFTS